jgi:photosystem II stability/assembly factor-like uncharacterized protein
MKLFLAWFTRSLQRWRRVLILLAMITPLAVFFGDHHRRWAIYLHARGVPKTHSLPIDQSGYRIEELPFQLGASYAREHIVHLTDTRGRIYRHDDRENGAPKIIGDSHIRPRLIFVSARGTIFVSGLGFPTLRSRDGGKTWTQTHELSVWRMTENEAESVIYAGIYTRKDRPRHHARLLKSSDEGETWQTVFEDTRLDHIHSVRWDPRYRRLYMSAGDGPWRGQAFSDDRGKTWSWMASGGKQGHTDVAISERFVLWGSDDNLGRILRAPRSAVAPGETILWASDHHVWWIVGRGRQIYAGTLTGERNKYSGAYLLASGDEGATWQKLLEDNDGGAPLSAFQAESRELSAMGWLYCATLSGKSYRVRRER